MSARAATILGLGVALAVAAAAPAGALTRAEAAWDRGDYAEAAKLWKAAADAGDARAQWLVGWLYDRGDRGLPKDASEALRWYRKATEGDDPASLYNRGLAHAWGKAGETRSLRSAESWYRRAAEAGGPEFQTRLARCYQGEALPPCGLRADYAQAERWFRRAAREGHAAAFCGLGQLHESGRGVARSQTEADAWFRKAVEAGRPCGTVVLAEADPKPAAPPAASSTPSEAALRQRAMVMGVQRELARLGFEPGPADGVPGRRTETAIFDFQTRMGLPADGRPSPALLAELQRQEVQGLGPVVARRPVDDGTPVDLPSDPTDIAFGRYHALVIGNDAYRELPGLGSARKDADAVAALLREDYGFEVTLLEDASRSDILGAFASLREKLVESDNLLVYYAGHSAYDDVTERGYWLPVDAAPDDRSNWISNGTLTDDIKAMDAKHVMVVADSCYSGTWTRALNLRDRSADYLARMSRKRARVVLASGNLEPVTDRGGRGHSVFARAFLDALAQNDYIIDGTQLFSQIRRPVMLDSEQTPQYGDIRNAGHGGGDFLFVRRPSGDR